MKNHSKLKSVCIRPALLSTCVCTALGFSAATAVHAQATEPKASKGFQGLEEVIVTATRREQSLQDIGVSVTAIDGDQLTSTGVSQTLDIVAQVPGLQFNQFSPAITVFNVRGVSQNDFGDQLEPPVAVYIDDAYVSTMGGVGVPAFDLARVEALRGPQGTQFGRNATGGLIHYVSKRPTKTLEGYINATGGSEGLFRTEGAVSGPISENAQFRLAGSSNRRDGYVKNDIGPDLGAQDNYALRGQLAFQPNENLDILLLGRYSSNDEVGIGYTSAPATVNSDGLGILIPAGTNPNGTCTGCDLNGYLPGPDPFHVSNNDVGEFDRQITQGQARFEWTLGDITISSITDYQEMDKDAGEDTDGSPTRFLQQSYTQRLEQFSEEIKISVDADNYRWLAGLYYLDWESDQGATLISEAASLEVSAEFPFITGYTSVYNTESWSVFAEGEFDITEELSVVVGARYVEDEKTANYRGFDNFGSELIFNPAVNPLAKMTFEDYSVRLGLNYQLSEDTLLYASYNRGIKGPNFSAPSFFPFDAADIPHDSETLHAFETGIKTTFADNRVRMNVGVFVYDYKDYQAFLFENVSNKVINRDAEAYGLEAEVIILPFEGLTLSGGISTIDSEVSDVPFPSGVGTFNPELPQAPDFSGNLLVRYEHSLSENLKGVVQFDVAHNGDSHFAVLSAPVDFEPSYTVANARISLADADENWEVAAFVKNLTDETYRVYSADVGSLGYIDSVYAQDRWYGVQFRYNFGE